MVTYCSSTYYSDHFETYRNIKSLCGVTGANSVVDQLLFQNQQTHRKEIRFVITRGGIRAGEIGGRWSKSTNFQLPDK